ncbi:MAG: alanine dehydrogenase [Sphaerospermopsis sp. SIO1G2]|nr:alanine dehydrogenase [Sphaerospermopsis sp. SIO1G2]
MKIGVPKETKDQEFRVGLSPSSVRVLKEAGHSVFVENLAGNGAGFTDDDYQEVGAKIVDAETAWAQEMVVKVKEPLKAEYKFLQKNQLLFTYLHLAAARELTESLMRAGTCAIAYETVEQAGVNRLPLLTPMSIIAGKLAVQFGARFLERQQGGRGVLLGGVPGVQPGKVVILGGGVVGTEAAKIAVGMGADVQILDVNVERLSYLETLFGSRVNLIYSNSAHIETAVINADLVIGAVLIPGRKAPTLVSRDLVKKMRPGSVIVDVAVDQGGCVETLYPTSHTNPVYVDEGVVHYGVPNMPGAVPWTSTQALNNSTLPYVVQLANLGVKALEVNPVLGKGLNVQNHKLVHPAVQGVFPDLVS